MGEAKLLKRWSGRPDSNRRRPAWEAGILPTELLPLSRHLKYSKTSRLHARPKSKSLENPRFYRRKYRHSF